MISAKYEPGSFESPIVAAERIEKAEREAKTQRRAVVMYVGLSYLATGDAHEDARVTAATWAKLVRDGKIPLPEFPSMIIYKIEQAGTGHVYARPETQVQDKSGYYERGLDLYGSLPLRAENIGKYALEVTP